MGPLSGALESWACRTRNHLGGQLSLELMGKLVLVVTGLMGEHKLKLNVMCQWTSRWIWGDDELGRGLLRDAVAA